MSINVECPYDFCRFSLIVAFLIQRNTKEMVQSGMCTKQENAEKFNQVKTEMSEMVKARLAMKPKVKLQCRVGCAGFTYLGHCILF